MLALEIFNWKEKKNARLPNTYGARLYIQNVCKNKCAVCAMYSVHIAYIYAHCAISLFIYPRRTNAFCAH